MLQVTPEEVDNPYEAGAFTVLDCFFVPVFTRRDDTRCSSSVCDLLLSSFSESNSPSIFSLSRIKLPFVFPEAESLDTELNTEAPKGAVPPEPLETLFLLD